MREEMNAREEKENEAFLVLERGFQLEMDSLKKEIESSKKDADIARAEAEETRTELETEIEREKEANKTLRKDIENLKMKQMEADASGDMEKKIRENAQLTAEINVLKDKVSQMVALESEVTRLKEKQALNESLENEIEQLRAEMAKNTLNDADAVIEELSALDGENVLEKGNRDFKIKAGKPRKNR